MSEIIENEVIEEIPQRVNPFCVISKVTYGEYEVRDIQTNGSWSENPYGGNYAVVPDEMVATILETRGFCDIVLNKDGTEVVSFTAREIYSEISMAFFLKMFLIISSMLKLLRINKTKNQSEFCKG